MAINVGPKFIGTGGCDTFPVQDITAEGSRRLGYIRQVFPDVFYVNREDGYYRDNKRYRSWEAALSALTEAK